MMDGLDSLLLSEHTRAMLNRYAHLNILKAPSVILKGKSGIGKSEAGVILARHLLNFPDGNLEIHPDFIMVSEEKSITKNAVEQLQERIMIRPAVAERKVVLILDADTMNDAAANSILKILEDDYENVVFIITASAKLMDTIESRCSIIEFASCSECEFRNYVQNNQVPFNRTAWIASGGRIGIYKSFLEKTEYLKKLDTFLDLYKTGSDREFLDCAGALKEKDKRYFYDSFTETELSGWFEMMICALQEMFLEKQPDSLSLKYADTMMYLLKRQSDIGLNLNRNDFFDVLRVMLEFRKEIL